MRLFAWGMTHSGCVRSKNEDALLINQPAGLYAVADGMGGHRGGERASKMAVELTEYGVERGLRNNANQDASPQADLCKAVVQAGRSINDVSAADERFRGMGTTLTAVQFHRGRFYLAHVGDSRCYLFRHGNLQQLTEDHSWVGRQLQAGVMSEEEARTSELRHAITRSLGFTADVEVDSEAMTVCAGDCILLCTDGLHSYMRKDVLRDYFIRGYYSEMPRRLVETAKTLGGEDNITVVVVYAAND